MTVLVIATLCASALAYTAFAQSSGEPPQVSANSDSALLAPIPQGQPGKSDPSAIREIEAAESVTSLPSQTDLSIAGRISTGIEHDPQGSQVALVMGGEGQFRTDIRDSEGHERGMRMIGRTGRIIGGPASIHPPAFGEFGDPLMFPIALKNIASGNNVAITDQGFLVVGDERLHEITVTHFTPSSTNQNAKGVHHGQAISLYFDPRTHLLMKSVVVGHSLTDVGLQYLQVTSYEAYKQVEGIMAPSRYVQTVGGQRAMVLNTTDVTLSQPHGDAYFK